MKLQLPERRNVAFTLIELLLILAIFVFMAILLYPGEPRMQRRAQRIGCASNLHQIGLAFRIWEGDHNKKYPMAVSVTNSGAMELIAINNVAGLFLAMSNELSTPRILICFADTNRIAATNFADLHNANISYFVNPDASETYPQMITIGDRNLAVSNAPIGPGLVTIASPNALSWTSALHKNVGNIGYADGSVSEVSASGLRQALALSTNGTPIPSTRLAIP